MDSKTQTLKEMNDPVTNTKREVFHYILQQIYQEKWKHGSKLPSEQQLSIKFNTTRWIIRSVLSTFTSMNYLFSVVGAGYFVNSKWFFDVVTSGKWLEDSSHKYLQITETQINYLRTYLKSEEINDSHFLSAVKIYTSKLNNKPLLTASLIAYTHNSILEKYNIFPKFSLLKILVDCNIAIGKISHKFYFVTKKEFPDVCEKLNVEYALMVKTFIVGWDNEPIAISLTFRVLQEYSHIADVENIFM